MDIRTALSRSAAALRAAGDDTARLDSYLLLASALGRDKTFLYAHPEYGLPPEAESLFSAYTARRGAHEPLAYIIGEKEFYSLPFKVNSGVLIPRPDSECVVDAALAFVGGTSPVQLLDMCCGSGCIGIAAAVNNENITCTFADISDGALAVCRENIVRHGLNERSRTVRSDLYDALPDGFFDIITVNPPYVSESEYAGLSEDIKAYEPVMALTGGSDGLDIYRRLASGSAAHMRSGGVIIMEIGCTQAEAVTQLFTSAGFGDVKTQKDNAGRDRVITAVKG